MKSREVHLGKYRITSYVPTSVRVTTESVTVTLRELEVFKLLSQEKTLKKVAKSLNISFDTAHGLVINAYSKNDFQSTNRRVDLIRRLKEEELLNDLAILAIDAIRAELWGIQREKETAK